MENNTSGTSKYREHLSNIDATVDTTNKISNMKVPWGLLVTLLVIVLLIVLVIYFFGSQIKSWWHDLTGGIRENIQTTQEEERSGQRATIDSTQAARIADHLYDCFKWWGGDDEAGIAETIYSLQSATDWHLVCAAFDKRACKLFWHSPETLPGMISAHLTEREKAPIRAHLLAKGVTTVGF